MKRANSDGEEEEEEEEEAAEVEPGPWASLFPELHTEILEFLSPADLLSFLAVNHGGNALVPYVFERRAARVFRSPITGAPLRLYTDGLDAIKNGTHPVLRLLPTIPPHAAHYILCNQLARFLTLHTVARLMLPTHYHLTGITGVPADPLAPHVDIPIEKFKSMGRRADGAHRARTIHVQALASGACTQNCQTLFTFATHQPGGAAGLWDNVRRYREVRFAMYGMGEEVYVALSIELVPSRKTTPKKDGSARLPKERLRADVYMSDKLVARDHRASVADRAFGMDNSYEGYEVTVMLRMINLDVAYDELLRAMAAGPDAVTRENNLVVALLDRHRADNIAADLQLADGRGFLLLDLCVPAQPPPPGPANRTRYFVCGPGDRLMLLDE